MANRVVLNRNHWGTSMKKGKVLLGKKDWMFW